MTCRVSLLQARNQFQNRCQLGGQHASQVFNGLALHAKLSFLPVRSAEGQYFQQAQLIQVTASLSSDMHVFKLITAVFSLQFLM
jgi:hypothetical protein